MSEGFSTAPALPVNPVKIVFLLVLLLAACRFPTLPPTLTAQPFTSTPTVRPTHTATPLPSATPTATATATPTRMPTWTRRPTFTPSPTTTPTQTKTPTPTPAVVPTVPPWSPFQPDSPTAWCWQEMMGLVNALNDVFFLDAQTGWAVGEKGTILHTEDGGKTWKRQICPVSGKWPPIPDLRHVVFTSSQTGWIMGTKAWSVAVLLHTIDGGQTWTEWPIPFTDLEGLEIDISWASSQIGWLIIGPRAFHTMDGGQTWHAQRLPVDASGSGLSINTTTLRAIHSIDDQRVLILTDGSLLRTNDGGETWEVNPIDLYSCQTFAFVDDLHGWVIGSKQGIDHIMYTDDSGQTWKIQYTEQNWEMTLQNIAFLDEKTGWVVARNRQWTSDGLEWKINDDILLYTQDGGITWKIKSVPLDRRAIAFSDANHGWAVGDIDERDNQRTTIAYTEDGGDSWQIQDPHIKMPPLFNTSVNYLDSYLTKMTPPLEALLTRLIVGRCLYMEEEDLIWVALRNLGWDGSSWGDSPADPYIFERPGDPQRLNTDLDQDSLDEIVLYGGGGRDGLFTGIMDWDGQQWQTAWFERTSTAHTLGGQVMVREENVEGHKQLWVATFTNPGAGTSIEESVWDLVFVECQHLYCYPIWTHRLGGIDVFWAWEKSYQWHGSDYQFLNQPDSDRPLIKTQRYGTSFTDIPTDPDGITSTLTVQIAPLIQSFYRWDGTQYTLTTENELKPGYILDITPITKTMDLDGDGISEQIVHRWIADWGGLQQTLSVYQSTSSIQPTQVFTAFVTGAITEPISIQDQGKEKSIVLCEPPLRFGILTADQRWPSFEPLCTTYHWDAVKQRFVPEP